MSATAARNVLKDMMRAGILGGGDKLMFQFKSTVFQCTTTVEGFLTSCTRKRTMPRDAPTVPIFQSRGPFLSLTDWSDSCIQEIANEVCPCVCLFHMCTFVSDPCPHPLVRDSFLRVEARASRAFWPGHVSVARQVV